LSFLKEEEAKENIFKQEFKQQLEMDNQFLSQKLALDIRE